MPRLHTRCTDAHSRHSTAGFTMVEMLIVIAIISIIASIAIPALNSRIERSRITRVAADLKTFEKGFLNFVGDTGEWPPDSHLPEPYHLASDVGIEHYLPIPAWVRPIPLGGGHYNWEGPDSYPYAGISLFATKATPEAMAKLDEILDDGDLTEGNFRVTSNGRYTYIIDE